MNLELPVLGRAPQELLNQCSYREWCEVRALSSEECASTFHKLKKEPGLQVGWVELLAEARGPTVCLLCARRGDPTLSQLPWEPWRAAGE